MYNDNTDKKKRHNQKADMKNRHMCVCVCVETLRTHHGVSLSGSGLTVGENAHVVAVDG